MIKKVINGELEITLLAILVIVALSTVINPLSHANEQIKTTVSIDESSYIEIEVVDDIDLLENEQDIIYAKSNIAEYESRSINSRDILRTLPSITTDDNKMLGLVIPPFAYFKTAF